MGECFFASERVSGRVRDLPGRTGRDKTKKPGKFRTTYKGIEAKTGDFLFGYPEKKEKGFSFSAEDSSRLGAPSDILQIDRPYSEDQPSYSISLPSISLKNRSLQNTKRDTELNMGAIEDAVKKSGIGKIELEIKDKKLNTLKLKIELERIKNPPPEPNPYLLFKTC